MPVQALFFEQCIKGTPQVRPARLRSSRSGSRRCGALGGAKIVAEVCAVLLDDPLGLGLATVIVRRAIVELTIKTDMQIAPTSRALFRAVAHFQRKGGRAEMAARCHTQVLHDRNALDSATARGMMVRHDTPAAVPGRSQPGHSPSVLLAKAHAKEGLAAFPPLQWMRVGYRAIEYLYRSVASRAIFVTPHGSAQFLWMHRFHLWKGQRHSPRIVQHGGA